MRPVRFVALSEDGQALVLADEVGRLLSLPLDDHVSGAVRHERHVTPGQGALSVEVAPALSPRDIQARIRAGESAEDVARVAGVQVDRVLRYAGPVLQERAMLAQHARRTRLRSSDRGAPLSEIVDKRLRQHGVDTENVSWDAYRKEDGTWRVVASWPSGKATARAIWDLDKARQVVTPFDDMAGFLSTERPDPLLGQEPAPERTRTGHEPIRSGRDLGRSGRQLTSPGRDFHQGHEPARADKDPSDEPSRPSRDPGRPLQEQAPAASAASTVREPRRSTDSLRTALERPLAEPLRPGASGSRQRPMASPAASLPSGMPGAGLDEERDPKDAPVVPALAVLRPRRTDQGATSDRRRLPSWDDVLFGGPQGS